MDVSTSFIYQPHIPEKEFQVELTGRVNTRREKTEAVVAWLLELAKWACLEPDTDQIQAAESEESGSESGMDSP